MHDSKEKKNELELGEMVNGQQLTVRPKADVKGWPRELVRRLCMLMEYSLRLPMLLQQPI
jgi:hypothetical protein